MTWPVSKLDLMNEALLLTANNPVNTANDGSDEWQVGDAAYEAGIEFMLDDHNWNEITRIQTLNPLPSPQGAIAVPQDEVFDTAYAKPPDCIHIIWVRLGGLPTIYTITGGNIEITAISGSSISNPAPPDAVPGVVTCKYVSGDPLGDQSAPAQRMCRTFMTALRLFTMAGLYAGLNEDLKAADATEEKAIAMLQRAKTRSDQDNPKRAMFNSRITASRRVRRPFPQVPTGWGGTGSPG